MRLPEETIKAIKLKLSLYMSKIYQTNSLSEALLLAKEFKDCGKYDLFRGQARNWDVVPTIGRCSKHKANQQNKRLERLFYFLSTISSTKKFRDSSDWFFAVAQHYGLATSFIDFSKSPEVAMYFATNSKLNKPNEQSVIICLNSIDFKNSIHVGAPTFLNKGIPLPEIIDINVDSLWRLEAQKGCFLYSPVVNFESFYPFDRIVFPFTRSYDRLNVSDIYPLDKSELETLLDHYFAGEERIEKEKIFDRFFRTMNISKTILPKTPVFKYVKSRANHHTWEKKSTKLWEYSVQDDLQTVVIINLTLKVDTSETMQENKQSLLRLITNEFALRGIDKATLVNFNWSGKSPNLNSVINDGCNKIWSGMRSLPYSINQIYIAIIQYVCLESFKSDKKNKLKLLFQDPILIEMTSAYGVHNRCYVCKQKIEKAFRDDIIDVLEDSLPKYIDSAILLYINKPRNVFDFNKLKDLFAEEIIPSQMLLQSKSKNPIIFYSPVYLNRLGYA
jgi:hypothetical protein